MVKLRFRLLMMITLTFIASTAMAQLFSFQSPPPQNKKNSPVNTSALSPAEFKNRVGNLSQKTQQELMQQTENNLKQPMPLPNAAPKPPSNKLQSPPSTGETKNSSSDNLSAHDTAPAISEPEPAKKKQPRAETSVNTNNENTSTPPAELPSAVPPAQNDVYTGFQSNKGTTNTGGSSGSSQSGGGFNIQY
ncbi:MAG: hypothetical protein ACD_45C00229G0004 [uncultured bacterium]|nr:MAG: hypothetical protein ACD_45C00229G0004 [uncultured bacterium]